MRWCCAGALVLLAAAISQPQVASGAFPGKNGRIVFVREDGRTQGLYSIRSDGTGRRKIVSAQDGASPSIDPLGRRITFTREGPRGSTGIFTVKMSGKHRQQLTPFDNSYRPSFSGPLGRRIAYSHPQGLVRKQIWVMASDGTEKRRVTKAKASAGSPAFSPDGKWIAYDRSDQIYKVRSDGSEVKRLTRSDRSSDSPSFSPSGKSIVFARRTRRGNAMIFLMRANGTHVRHLFGPVFNPEPAFSPNGNRIVFIDDDAVYTMNRRGRDLERVTPRSWRADQPDWAVRR